MEHPENVRKQLEYKPFRPFYLETVSGKMIRVERAEWFHEVPKMQGQLIISDESGVTITYWQDLIDTIEVDAPKRSEQ